MRTFSFSHTWRLPADVDRAYSVLADVDSYPSWWPQVRRIQRIDDSSGHAYVRSLLPYTLDLVLTRSLEDPDDRVLRVRISGDLEGWSEWRLEPAGEPSTADAAEAGSRARYSQVTTVSAHGLARLPPVAAPILRANHTWMMLRGGRGLVRHLRAGNVALKRD